MCRCSTTIIESGIDIPQANTLVVKRADMLGLSQLYQIRGRVGRSDVTAHVQILRDLRLGTFDVLVGINLLREGLDLPEVSLVAILDADQEGFLRSAGALIQTIGRAAPTSTAGRCSMRTG